MHLESLYILSPFLGTSTVLFVHHLFLCCMNYVHCVSCPLRLIAALIMQTTYTKCSSDEGKRPKGPPARSRRAPGLLVSDELKA